MRSLLTGRVVTLFAAAATILVMGAGTATAQAQTHVRVQAVARSAAPAPSSPRTLFTCPSRNVCFFAGDNYSGAHKSYPAASNHSRCESTTVGGEHAGSLNDKTNSIIILYDNSTGTAICLHPGKNPLDHEFGYWYLMYNVHSCPTTVPSC